MQNQSISLTDAQLSNLRKYLRREKPSNWKQKLSWIEIQPSWKLFIVYYDLVQSGDLSDRSFASRWSVNGQMPPIHPHEPDTEGLLVKFLSDIKSSQIALHAHSSGAASDQPPSSTSKDSAALSAPPSGSLKKPSRGRPATSGEKKKTISLMIEPSLYERVKELADYQGRSVGAEVRHALRLHLDANAHNLDDEGNM